MAIDKEIQPLVSIIVPSYNHAKYITQCVESIMQQTYSNFELIVIDDGSSDNTKEILENLQLKYNFTLAFQKNKGISFTLNRGIKEFSKGKYLSFCASDDYWLNDKIENQILFMENNQFYPMCYGKTHYVNESSEVLKEYDYQNEKLKGGFVFEELFLFKLQPPVNFLFSKKIFEEVGYYDENIFAEDYDMNLKIAFKYPIGFIDKYLGYYRLTDIPKKISRNEIGSNSHLQTIENFKDHKNYKIAKSTVHLRNFNTFSGFTAHKRKALKYLKKSLSMSYKKQFIFGLTKLLVFWKA